MKENLTHEEKILIVVSRKKLTPTYDVIRQGIDMYVGTPDRTLRRLQEKGLVFGEVLDKKVRYKYWSLTSEGKKQLKAIFKTNKN